MMKKYFNFSERFLFIPFVSGPSLEWKLILFSLLSGIQAVPQELLGSSLKYPSLKAEIRVNF